MMDLNRIFGGLLMFVGLTDIIIALGLVPVFRSSQFPPLLRAGMLGVGSVILLAGGALALGFFRFL
jgi:hypothetical protein